ncbi:MAG: NAD-binding protein [Candidatus Kariarchaeaceae archaeon]|jgi:S-adenosylhomocysteine hydrolase
MNLRKTIEVFENSKLFQTQLAEMPIFQYLIKDYQKSQPFLDKNIAIAHVLVPNILPMIYSVIIGGGKVTITNCCPPTIDNATIDLLTEAGCTVNLDLPSAKEFDYALDCTAHFVDFAPKYGVVEVTRTGIHRYKQKASSTIVVNVDNTKSKMIETFIGNPKAVLRGINTFIEDPHTYLSGKTMAIIGFGKIGRGLARLFKQYCRIIVVDIDDRALNIAERLNFETVKLIEDKQLNTENIKTTDIFITSTGHPGVVSNRFIKSSLNASLFLNVGASDEYGDDYSVEEVFMSKDKPFNFNLIPPTENKYIDPILAAQVEGLRYLVSTQLETGIHDLPHVLDQELVDMFVKYNQEDLSDIELYFDNR